MLPSRLSILYLFPLVLEHEDASLEVPDMERGGQKPERISSALLHCFVQLVDGVKMMRECSTNFDRGSGLNTCPSSENVLRTNNHAFSPSCSLSLPHTPYTHRDNRDDIFQLDPLS